MQKPYASSLSLLAVACGGCLVAQNTFVVPSKANTTEPGALYYDSAPQSYPFWGTTGTTTESRVQYLYDAADIPVNGVALNSVSVRQPRGYTVTGTTVNTTITVSVGPNGPNGASSSFANNHGQNATVVHTGAINLPQLSAVSTWPAAWQTPIPFASPVAYQPAMGQSLVIEFQTTSNTAARSWTLEGYRAEWGFSRSEYYQSSCRNSGGNASGGWSWQPSGLVPGGSFYLNLSSYPSGTPSLANNALFFGVQGLGGQVGALTTPFALSSLNLPADPSCNWGISIINGFPMQYVDSGTSGSLRMQSVGIPNDPNLINAQFYTQNLALDVDAAGMPQLFPSIAIRWVLGTGNTVPCTRVSTIYDPSSPRTTGSVARSEGAALQFGY